MPKAKVAVSNVLAYKGRRKGSFFVVGGVTGRQYLVDGEVVVNPADVRWFLGVNGGKDYEVAKPKPKPEPEPEPEPKLMPIADPDTWTDLSQIEEE